MWMVFFFTFVHFGCSFNHSLHYKREQKIFATYDTYQTDYNLDGDAFGNVILNNLEEMARQYCVLIMYMCTT